MNVHVSEHVRGRRAQETGGCGKGVVGTGTGAELPLEGRRLAPEPCTRALCFEPLLVLGWESTVERGAGARGSGVRVGEHSETWASPSVSCSPPCPRTGMVKGVQTGRPELGGGVDRCAPPYCTLRQGDK